MHIISTAWEKKMIQTVVLMVNIKINKFVEN